ncbi:phospholipase A2-like protein Y52B11A.8 [Ditylenchus destructor]|uniref:Phospholipase A2-like protein Y52B11A.8 n=1 Tax=Ditylenchus destructor TaxID=166010 RepID=A0AAD4QZL9_9BILA|nr:phospholipase A2-like protein Y52B11A.8 [Ditylenchus destructor]
MITSLIFIFLIAHRRLASSDWVCGSGDIMEGFSEKVTDLVCPDKKEAANECCQAHDNCYMDQKGRLKCDNDFCECLQRTVISPADSLSKGNNESEKLIVIADCNTTQKFCALARDHGQAAYDKAGKDKAAYLHAASQSQKINFTFDVLLFILHVFFCNFFFK